MTKEQSPQTDLPLADQAPKAQEPLTFNSAQADTEPEVPRPKKKIDPWRFGFHTVPPGMQATLLANPLPETPKERIYRSPGPLPEASGESAAPLATDEISIPKRDFRLPVMLAVAAALLLVAVVVVLRFTNRAQAVVTPSSAKAAPAVPLPVEAESAPLPRVTAAVPVAADSAASPPSKLPVRVEPPHKPRGQAPTPRQGKPPQVSPVAPAPERAPPRDARSILAVPADD